MKDQNEKIRMRPCKDWNVHWNCSCVRLVQADAKIPFSTQEKQNKDSDMDQAHFTLVRSGFVQMMQDWCENLQDVTGFQDVKEKFFVVLAKLPEKYLK